MVQLSIGDKFTLPTAIATDNVDGNITGAIQIDKSEIEHLYDLFENKYIFNEIKEYQVIYYVYDTAGNYTEVILKIVVSENNEEEINFEGYYITLNGLSGNELINALYTLLNNTGSYSTTTYGQARYYLEETDKWVGYNENYLYLIYTDTLKGSVKQGYPDEGYAYPAWDSGATWNREHVWAKSLFGNGGYDPGDSTRGIDADLHNLRAADTTVNSTRGNNKFINVVSKPSFGNYNSLWYPGDNHRGDVARIIFYMDIRWGSLTDINKIGDLNTLLEWHLLDPVDEFEIRRNELIYGYQKNRNPFIDYPELANMIYVN